MIASCDAKNNNAKPKWKPGEKEACAFLGFPILADCRSATFNDYSDLVLNPLGQTIPKGIGTLVQMEELQLAFNDIYGSLIGKIPNEIGKLKKLWNLEIQENLLTGKIPATLSNLVLLQKLILSENKLTGKIPPSLSKCTLLEELDLHENKLNGKIPSSLALLTKITALDFSDNDFTGTMPSELCALAQMNSFVIGVDCGEITCPTDCPCAPC